MLYPILIFIGIRMFAIHLKTMKIRGRLPFFFIAVLAWTVVISSCANLGMPSGGPMDSLPPVLIGTHPKFKALNYKGKDVRFTFDEYIATEAISEALVVSPPLKKRPIIRTKSKTLVIEFNEDLLDSATYSLDFKNSIVDNNEKNAYKNMRFSFSTGNVYDSLRVAGRVLNAFNLEPVENAVVLLHKNLHDSAVYSVRPNYIAKTDKEGLFMIDNIATGKYHLFSLNDMNNDLMYNEGAEEMAFVDSLIIPTAEFHEELDTLVSGVDSMLIFGHTQFYPEPIYLRQFTEDIFEQYIKSYKRETRNKAIIVFNESVSDTFGINVIDNDAKDWYLLEYEEKMDSLVVWIADTTLSRQDTLLFEVSYFQVDSMENLYVKKDTLQLNFTDKADTSKKKKKLKEGEEDQPEPIEQFTWETTIRSSVVELNEGIKLRAKEPILYFDSTKITLYLTEDTLKSPLPLAFEKDSTEWRTYKLNYKWKPETGYTLEIDSAASVNIFGITSKKMQNRFSTREEDYYGSRILNFTGVTMPMIAQLLSNDAKEEVIRQKTFVEDGEILFDYLPPGKYKIKVIYDANGNGKWDNGSFQDKVQPEKVAYVNEVVKVRGNWHESLAWDLKPDLTFTKKIIDLELEEKLRKEAEEKKRKESEKRGSPENMPNMQNMMQGGGGF